MRRAAPILAALLLLAAYWPAFGAGWIWDDDSYVWRNAVVQSPSGIVDCWVPGRTPQWYPLVFLSFWVQHAVHGLEPFGYHLVNVLLHGLSGLLLWRLLRALGLAGAGLAATLFLLHPMQVESVAWVTERKNVLSMAFALGAMLAWVRWLSVPAGGRGASRHAATAFALFVLAMLSKTTAVAVPVAMAAVAWWRPWPALAGEARPVRRVAAALAPFFALGIAMGLFTAWIEVTVVGASGGAEFRRGLAERVLHQRAEVGLVAGEVSEISAAAGQVVAVDGPALQRDLAVGGRQQAGQDPQQGGLAGTVAAQHQQGLARPQLEIEGAEHRLVVAREAKPAGLQQRGRGGRGVGHCAGMLRAGAGAVHDAGQGRPGNQVAR